MNRLSQHQGAGSFTAEDEIWAGFDRSDRSLGAATDMPTGRRILAIAVVYGALLCVGVITLVL